MNRLIFNLAELLKAGYDGVTSCGTGAGFREENCIR